MSRRWAWARAGAAPPAGQAPLDEPTAHALALAVRSAWLETGVAFIALAASGAPPADLEAWLQATVSAAEQRVFPVLVSVPEAVAGRAGAWIFDQLLREVLRAQLAGLPVLRALAQPAQSPAPASVPQGAGEHFLAPPGRE